jgi:hypothetical protein
MSENIFESYILKKMLLPYLKSMKNEATFFFQDMTPLLTPPGNCSFLLLPNNSHPAVDTKLLLQYTVYRIKCGRSDLSS